MKLQLLNLLSDYPSKYFLYEVPLGLLSIASYIKQNKPDVKVEILDEVILSKEDIRKKLDGDIIGITTLSVNYKSVLEMAKFAKQKNKIIVLGGSHINYMADAILERRKYIDYLVKGEGEKALLAIINNIQNNKHSIGKEPEILQREWDVSFWPNIDYSLINMNPYYQKSEYYTKILGNDLNLKWLSYITHKGCLWREQNGPCIFCCIQDEFKRKNPERIWNEIKALTSKDGVNCIRDIGDDFTFDKQWLKELVKRKPEGIDCKIVAYSRGSNLDKEKTELFHELNCIILYIGFESGNDELLKIAQKGLTVKNAIKSVELLDKRGIKIIGNFVLGLQGESEESLKNTVNFAKQLSKFKNVLGFSALILIPFPGSQAFEMLKENFSSREKGEIFNTDLPDLNNLQKIWVMRFCNVDIEKIKKYQEEINNIRTLPASII